jgi:hypothetical protein
MDENIYGGSQEDSILNQVREGMQVLDSQGNRVGRVADIRFGDAREGPIQRGRGPASAEGEVLGDQASVLPDFAVGMTGSPDEGHESDLISKQMQLSGYLVVDAAGLFSGERFVLPEQIAAVKGEEVHLNIDREKLPKR